MGDKHNYHFGVKIDKLFEGLWSFGCCISHGLGETYLLINFAKWCIAIGWLEGGNKC